jgi:initiation factor 1A
MPHINKKGGKNFKKGKKNGNIVKANKLQLADRDENHEYAKVKRKLGNDRLEVECVLNNVTTIRQGIIPGSFIKRVWINVGDILLVQINPVNNKECFILYKYDNREAKSPAETFYESKNLPLDGSSTPMAFMTKTARKEAVSDATADFNTDDRKTRKLVPAQTEIDKVRNEKGGVNGDLTMLMLDNINRFVVTGCTHVDGTAPSTAETNLEGDNVGDGIMALGDKDGVYYSPSIVANSEYFLSNIMYYIGR